MPRWQSASLLRDSVHHAMCDNLGISRRTGLPLIDSLGTTSCRRACGITEASRHKKQATSSVAKSSATPTAGSQAKGTEARTAHRV